MPWQVSTHCLSRACKDDCNAPGVCRIERKRAKWLSAGKGPADNLAGHSSSLGLQLRSIENRSGERSRPQSCSQPCCHTACWCRRRRTRLPLPVLLPLPLPPLSAACHSPMPATPYVRKAAACFSDQFLHTYLAHLCLAVIKGKWKKQSAQARAWPSASRVRENASSTCCPPARAHARTSPIWGVLEVDPSLRWTACRPAPAHIVRLFEQQGRQPATNVWQRRRGSSGPRLLGKSHTGVQRAAANHVQPF